MRPTPDDALLGADRLLEAMVAEHDLPADVIASVVDVRRMLKAVRTTWAVRLPFLLADNARLVDLLTELRPKAPATLTADFEAQLNPAAPTLDPAETERRNEDLRTLLSRLIRELPTDDATARARIHTYLVERTDLAPA